MRPPKVPQVGLTLLEIIVVLAITLLLAGLLIPAAKDLIDKSKADSLLETTEILRTACLRYNQDMGSYAIEDSGPPGSPVTDPQFRMLSLEPFPAVEKARWKGPYLNEPLMTANSPFGGQITVRSDLQWIPGDGFDLLGNGTVRLGPGNCVLFYGVPESIARRVDEALDPDFRAGWEWFKTGKVNWREGEDLLVIYLFSEG